MEYRKLGKTELFVSPICVGAWQLAGPLAFDSKPDGHPDPGKQNTLNLIKQLGEKSVNFIDTAEQYGNGESEQRVGLALKGLRDKWIISTKFGYRVAPDGTREDDSSHGTIMSSLEGSLKRMSTDYIDVYLYHCAPQIDDIEAGQEILEQARQQGKIRYYGISSNNLEIIKALHVNSMLDVLQYHTNILEPRSDIYDFVSKHEIGTQVRGVMAQGRLSGKYFHKAVKWQDDDNRSDWFKHIDYQRYSVFEKAIPPGYTMAQVAIRWALDQPAHHTICMGAKNLTDYETAIKACDLPPLSQDVLQQLSQCTEDINKL